MDLLSRTIATVLGFLRCLCVIIWIEPWTRTPRPKPSPPCNYGDWYEWHSERDSINGVDDWAIIDRHSAYDWQILRGLKRDLERCRQLGDDWGLCSHLRAQSSRNICGILSAALYRKSPIQTKRLIHDYIIELRQSIAYLADRNSTTMSNIPVPLQEKRQVLHDMRRTLGRTSLLLQGGAMVSMSHLGVVKSLFEQRILPQIITGTASGALVAALVCTTTDTDLPTMCRGSEVNLDAFVRARLQRSTSRLSSWLGSPFLATIRRRYKRYQTTRHFFDIAVLEQCVRDNLKDITFEEAYAKTGRILNITIAMAEVAGTPQLLNYITAPHVLIWSAVVASIATSKQMYAPVQLLCKSDTGAVIPYFAADFAANKTKKLGSVHPEAPLQRIGELFNVNHFIVSQTRPYVAPFIQLQKWADNHQPLGITVRLILSELLHWLKTWNRLGLLPTSLQRVLIDEVVPSIASWSKVSITPKLGLCDLLSLFDHPTTASIEKWSVRGEKSTWPLICEIKCRCDVEEELNAAYASVRRRGLISPSSSD